MNTPDDFVSQLASNHSGQLERFLRTRVANGSDIPDIIQEVFLRMLRVPNHEAIRSPEAYLFTVAQHVAQQHALRQSAVSLRGRGHAIHHRRSPALSGRVQIPHQRVGDGARRRDRQTDY